LFGSSPLKDDNFALDRTDFVAWKREQMPLALDDGDLLLAVV
jgi:hypothetical protein